jgi:hypothetical protein
MTAFRKESEMTEGKVPRFQPLVDPLSIAPFELKDRYHELAKHAVEDGLVPSTISVARGDPMYPAPRLAGRVYEFLLGVANNLSDLLGQQAKAEEERTP